ncbi:hypothetical protein BWQ96_07698 [Gracilariopsis chorda]|uniref:Uncharacterized protein n=1 Tax=Gracilariopsis chorda TaxID=448386 RepID=A0A2V3IKB3_9FLOR|nr:hypothetical protein BWQ96_07698 [Gracilariopsis chorda]|eukprot:PXF42536.1 hypothetical protein BWQ96_07698 [Gracilariopsis chorda]
MRYRSAVFLALTCIQIGLCAGFVISPSASKEEWDGSRSEVATVSAAMAVLDRSARGWQRTALERAQQKLNGLREELRLSKQSKECRSQKKHVLRTLYWKKKLMKCRMSNMRKARFECRKGTGVRKMMIMRKKKCKWNRRCFAKKVWPLQWRLRKSKKGCDCVKRLKVMKQIWKIRKVKCGEYRKAYVIQAGIKKVGRKVKYLEKLLRPKPSIAPRPY